MRTPFILFALGFAASFVSAEDYPSHTLKAEKLSVKVYLPDAEKGFYRGTRFDWSGVCTVEFEQHKLFGPWKDKHDPKNNDDIFGPCEEFGSGFSSPLIYKAAKVGERFLKIGVGELEKPKENEYRFYNNYTIAKAGDWNIEKTERTITFTQELKTDFGYAYAYTKTLSVNKVGTELRIDHTLVNAGEKEISTDCYNHNFFNVDSDPVGKNYELHLNFKPMAVAKERFAELVKIDGQRLVFQGSLDKGQVYAELSGFDRTTQNGGILKHKPSGLSVRFQTDRPLSRFNLWGIGSTICPEPFVHLDLKSGKSVKWSTVYTFSKATVK